MARGGLKWLKCLYEGQYHCFNTSIFHPDIKVKKSPSFMHEFWSCASCLTLQHQKNPLLGRNEREKKMQPIFNYAST